MKNIQLSQIKGETFSLISIIEECIEIIPNDVAGMKHDIDNVLVELEGLQEALFFKKEKIGQNKVFDDDEKHRNLERDVENKLRRIKIEPLGDAKNILETNKGILELKLLQKIFRYTIEMNENTEKILSSLLHSDVPEDWIFLCTLLFYSLKYNKLCNHEILQSYTKKIEEKIKNLFAQSREKNDISQMKNCYVALKELDKQFLIYESYMYGFDLFTKPLNVFPPDMTTVNLTNFNIQEHSYKNLLKDIRTECDRAFDKDVVVFGNSDEYFEYISDKIYRVLVFKGLELFLCINDPILYLLSLHEVYNLTEELSTFLGENIKKSNLDEYFSEAFSAYIFKAIELEKDCFDFILNVLINNEVSIKKYIICGLVVKQQTRMMKAFEMLLVVVDLMVKRAKRMYTEEDKNELLVYFFRRMNSLLDKMVLEAAEKIELINELSKVYVLTKKYLNEKIAIISDFTSKISALIQDAFDFKINYINLTIKKKINNMYFTSKGEYKKLLVFLKKSIKEGEVLQGRNYNIYTDRILAYMFKRLHKHILGIMYTKEQADNLLHSIDEIQGYVLFINRTAMAHHYNYLRNICKLITVEKDKFMAEYDDLENLITDRDIKALIKCREDREDIQSLVCKK